MDKLVDSIGRNFERLLRWLYPGALFLVLLRLSRPQDFTSLATFSIPLYDTQPQSKTTLELGIASLIVAGLVAGFVVYFLQAYVLNHLVVLVFQVWNYDVNVGLQRPVYQDAPQPRWGLRRLARIFDRHAMSTWERWSGQLRESLGNYLNYAWATYHAVFITGWLTLAFFFFKEDGSFFAEASPWKVILPAVLLLAGGLWTYLHLSRVPFRRPQ